MYRTYDYKCDHCGWHDVQLHVKGEQPNDVACTECGGTALFMLSAPNIMNVALPDGTKRFQDLKMARQLDRVAAEAKRDRDSTTYHKAKQELTKLVKGD